MKNQKIQNICNYIGETIEGASMSRLDWVIDCFEQFKTQCHSNEQEAIVRAVITACITQKKELEAQNLAEKLNIAEIYNDLKNECELNSLENQSVEC